MTVVVTYTGTAKGMSQEQKQSLAQLLMKLTDGDLHLHHGDCVGGDEQAHQIGFRHGARLFTHPSNDPSKRAFCKVRPGDEAKPRPPLTRNAIMADIADVVVAAPKGYAEERRSGTWATVRYARKLGRRVFIIWPNGRVQEEIRDGEG